MKIEGGATVELTNSAAGLTAKFDGGTGPSTGRIELNGIDSRLIANATYDSESQVFTSVSVGGPLHPVTLTFRGGDLQETNLGGGFTEFKVVAVVVKRSGPADATKSSIVPRTVRDLSSPQKTRIDELSIARSRRPCYEQP